MCANVPLDWFTAREPNFRNWREEGDPVTRRVRSERKCADTIGTVLVAWVGHFQCCNINMFFSQIKYTEAILSDSTAKLLWFEITKNAHCSSRRKFVVSFIIIFGTLSFPIGRARASRVTTSYWLAAVNLGRLALRKFSAQMFQRDCWYWSL